MAPGAENSSDRSGGARETFRLCLLGPFSASCPAPLAITARKSRALLAVLALSPGLRATRERICGLLWGDSMEEQARSSLRQSLAVLRKELGPHADILVARDDVIGLAGDRIWIDVLQAGALAGREDEASLGAAASLLAGELLADTSLKEEAFGEWLRAERQALAARATSVLERLATMPGNPGRIDHARRLVALDPLREASHRALMEAYAASGDRAQALRQFEICRDLLHRELGVEPSAQTKELRNTIAGAGREPILPGSRTCSVSNPSTCARKPSRV